MTHSIMVATVGGQPQVVTFALDSLLSMGHVVDEVILLHMATGNSRYRSALQKIVAEFHNDSYRGRACKVRLEPLKVGAQALTSIRTEDDAEQTWLAVRNLISSLKTDGHSLHLCVTGGRRMVALLVMSAAALLCDHRDRLWHMYTPDELQEAARGGALMHADPVHLVQLIEVPLVPWGAYFPGLRAMAQAPQEAVASQMGWLRQSEEQCQQVYDRLTERQRDVLVALARGESPQDTAENLSITMATVNSHKTVIFNECRVAWGYDENERLDFHFLRERFGPYFEQSQ